MKDNAMKKGSRTDWERLDEMKDAAIDTSDIPELDDDFFQQAKVKVAPKCADMQRVQGKFAELLNSQLHSERKSTDKPSPSPSIRKPGNSEA